MASVVPLTAISVLAAVGLLFVRPRIPRVDGQTISAVILAAPIVVASFLARPGEHAFAARMLRGFRFNALLVGVCALVVAAVLGLGFVDRPATNRFDCRPARGPDAVVGERICRPSRPTEADVPAGAQLAADIATWAAVALAGVMLAGTFAITLRHASRRRRESIVDGGESADAQ
jgi:hypothetical protein